MTPRIIVLALVVAACTSRAPATDSASSAPRGATADSARVAPPPADPGPIDPPPVAARLAASDLRALRWIEGAWRGTGDGQAPFYERYRFVDDSTLDVESFADSTLAKATDVTRYALRGGRFANEGSGAQWVAVSRDGSAISFAPVRGARNSFTWRPESRDLWIATLTWPAAGTTPARTRTYRMARWTPPGR